jgi:hypothetical protein
LSHHFITVASPDFWATTSAFEIIDCLGNRLISTAARKDQLKILKYSHVPRFAATF